MNDKSTNKRETTTETTTKKKDAAAPATTTAPQAATAATEAPAAAQTTTQAAPATPAAAPQTAQRSTASSGGVPGRSPYIVPAGRYRGRIESASLKESLEQATPYYDCVGVILDDIVVQGRNVRNVRLPWSGFLKQESSSALRTIRSMQAAGCTFPNDDFEDYTGLGSRDVEFEVEEEDPYTPEATEENPEPTTIYRSRIAWVNPLVRGMAGKEVDAGTRKKIGESMKGLIKAARSGARTSSGENPDDGIPRDPVTGRKMF